MQIALHNKQLLKLVVHHLGDLAEQFLFVGGSIVGLLLTEEISLDVRATYDVDCVVDVVSLSAYHQIEKQLRQKGFKQCLNVASPICRWQLDELVLDVVPTDEHILGFGNRWYKEALLHANVYPLDEVTSIQLISAPYFIATKWEAFQNRGQGDYLSGHDLEDIITVIDGCPGIVEEMMFCERTLQAYLAEVFSGLLNDEDFLDALPGHLNSHLLAVRLPIVTARLKKIAQLV